MPEQVNVPGVGKTDRKWVLTGLAAVAGIVVYAYMRRARDTGPAPGSDEQLDAAGYVPSDWSPDAYVGATRPGGETYDPSDVADTTPLTNAEWSQRVVDLLEGVGIDRTKAAATIGKYLSGQPLDASEKLIVQTAIALLGNPPAGALPIISAPSTPTTTPPSTATKLAKPTLRYWAGLTTNTIYGLGWTRVPGAAYYIVQRSAGPGAPTSVGVIGTQRLTPPLKRGATYSYRVRAIAVPGTGKTSSDWSNTVRFTVPRK
jgi:hypothetical protein